MIERDPMDDELAAGFEGLELPPERVAALMGLADGARDERTHARSPWPLVGLAVAAAAALMLAWMPGRLPTRAPAAPDGEPVAAAAPGEAEAPPLDVPAGMRAVSAELDMEDVWSGLVVGGARVDVVVLMARDDDFVALEMASSVPVLASTDDGLVTLALSPGAAERLVHADSEGHLRVLADRGRGRRAVALQVDSTAVRSGLAEPGSRVDVLITRARDDQLETVAVATDLAVLLHDGHDQVVLDVTPEEARSLLLAETTGRLSLTLRGGPGGR